MPTPDAFLKLPEVIERTTLSRRTIYRRMRKGTFPQAVKLGENSVAWRVSELVAWMEQPAQWSVAA